MNASTTFDQRGRSGTITLLAIGLLLVGIVAYRFLPVASMPNVELPTIRVSASRPGADPAIVAATVAAPLERTLGTIAGVTEITSGVVARADHDYGAVRSVAQHRRRGARRAGGDQRLAHQSAERPAVAAVVPQGQSGGVSRADPGAHLEDDRAERDL